MTNVRQRRARIYTEDDYAVAESAPEADAFRMEDVPDVQISTIREVDPPDRVELPPVVDEWETEDAYLPQAVPDQFAPADDDWYLTPAPPDGLYDSMDHHAFAPDFSTGLNDEADDELYDTEEFLTDEERTELRRSRWMLLGGLGDFAGVILGTAAILVLVMLLVSLLNWLMSDISQSFTLLQMRFE